MSNVIIGTAGHVDHGKTQLIKALTGFDTDSIKEEKERGITIEPGFAYLTLPGGKRCGIIDVPGHEKFLRNMLAGAGSIDIVLFVVACDEGMMPQSREHLDILSLLGIERGIVVLTKCDLADADWLELVTLDVADAVKGTFLEKAPVIPVSAKTGEGIAELKTCLFNMIAATKDSETNEPFRLPIDRVFTVGGFGTVVTGTLTSGRITAGAEATLYPALKQVKARGLQVHSQPVQTACKGQRVAVNLAGVKTSELQKGCVLAAPASMTASLLLDVKLDIVESTARTVLNNSKLHFHHGTSETLCRLVLLDADELKAGQSGYAQLHLAAALAVHPGDRFVVRFYSPTETVGGGVILDPAPYKRKRRDEEVLKVCRIKESGDLKAKIACFVADRSRSFPQPREIKRLCFGESPFFDGEMAALIAENEIVPVKDSVIHQSYLLILKDKCLKLLNSFHAENPLLEGMRRDELRSKLLPGIAVALSDEIISLLSAGGYIRTTGNIVAAAEFAVSMNPAQKKLFEEITALLLSGGFTPPSVDELLQRYPNRQNAVKQTLAALLARADAVSLTPQILIHNDFYLKAKDVFASLVLTGPVTLAAFRDAIGASRKYAVAILDDFDKKGWTKMEGEARVLTGKTP